MNESTAHGIVPVARRAVSWSLKTLDHFLEGVRSIYRLFDVANALLGEAESTMNVAMGFLLAPEFDFERSATVIYSLRHTDATFRLHEGVNHFTSHGISARRSRCLRVFYGHTSNRAMASELTKTRSKGTKRLPWEKRTELSITF